MGVLREEGIIEEGLYALHAVAVIQNRSTDIIFRLHVDIGGQSLQVANSARVKPLRGIGRPAAEMSDAGESRRPSTDGCAIVVPVSERE